MESDFTIILLISALLFLVHCSGKEMENSNLDQSEEITTIAVNVDEVSPLKTSDFFKNIDYYYLETPEGQPMGRIEKIQIQDSLIVLFDKIQRKVWVYDKSLNYINDIEIKKGRGPGEVEHLLDVYMSKDQKIHIAGSYKILVYDKMGQVGEEIPLEFIVRKISYSENEQKYYGYTGVSLNSSLEKRHRQNTLLVFDRKGKIVRSYLPLRKGKEGILYEAPNTFPESKSSKLFFKYLVDTVFTIGEEFRPLYSIDYGKNTIPSEVFKKRDRYGTEVWQWTDFWENEIAGEGYLYYLSNFEVSNSYIHFRVGNRENYYMILHDRENNKTHVGKDKFVNDIDQLPLPYIYVADSKYLYSYIESYDLLKFMNEMYKEKPEFYRSEAMSNLRQVTNSLDDTRNPIFVRLEYK